MSFAMSTLRFINVFFIYWCQLTFYIIDAEPLVFSKGRCIRPALTDATHIRRLGRTQSSAMRYLHTSRGSTVSTYNNTYYLSAFYLISPNEKTYFRINRRMTLKWFVINKAIIRLYNKSIFSSKYIILLLYIILKNINIHFS